MSIKKYLTLHGSKFADSIQNSTIDNAHTSQEKLSRILNFKDFRGFKKIDNIKDRYKIGRVLGEGSFGQVRIAMHRQGDIKCAIKMIRKDKIS